MVLVGGPTVSAEFTDTITDSKMAETTKRQKLKDLILEVKNITKEVNSPEGPLTIVKDVNLSIEPGELVSLVGPSGSGKTTLLAIMAGLDLPSAGSITLLGSEITLLDEDQRAQIRGRDVGFVFQSFHLMPKLSALDNVMLPLEISGIEEAQSKAKEALISVGLEKRAQHFPTQLSGGEKQRVAIARAMVNKPKILFADEPTGNLDTKSSSAITDLIFSLNDLMQTTLVLVTHDLALAEKCSKVYELSEGELL
jgi:putative ABC transport system ATP-binding protein